MNADDDLLKLFGPREEVSGFDLEFLVVAGKAARLAARVRGAELHDDGARVSPYAESRCVSRITRNFRVWPPMIVVSETSSTCFSECSSSAAIRRNW